MAVGKEETMLEKMNAVRPLFHLIVALTMQFVALSIVTPAIIGVIVEAICPPGQAECGRVIFLSGFQQMSVGIGAMAMTPIIGSLSDNYGRKPLLTITCAANILPLCKIPFILLFRSAYYSNVALMYKGYSFLNRFSDRLFFSGRKKPSLFDMTQMTGLCLTSSASF
jgi:MFS family permease